MQKSIIFAKMGLQIDTKPFAMPQNLPILGMVCGKIKKKKGENIMPDNFIDNTFFAILPGFRQILNGAYPLETSQFGMILRYAEKSDTGEEKLQLLIFWLYPFSHIQALFTRLFMRQALQSSPFQAVFKPAGKVIPGESKSRIGAATNNRKNPYREKQIKGGFLTWKN